MNNYTFYIRKELCKGIKTEIAEDGITLSIPRSIPSLHILEVNAIKFIEIDKGEDNSFRYEVWEINKERSDSLYLVVDCYSMSKLKSTANLSIKLPSGAAGLLANAKDLGIKIQALLREFFGYDLEVRTEIKEIEDGEE